MRVFISQKMKGLSDEDIQKEREKAVKAATKHFKKELAEGEDLTIIDSVMQLDVPALVKAEGAYYLGESIKLLSTADRAYFVKGWSEARGCKIEFMVAKEYGIKFYCE